MSKSKSRIPDFLSLDDMEAGFTDVWTRDEERGIPLSGDIEFAEEIADMMVPGGFVVMACFFGRGRVPSDGYRIFDTFMDAYHGAREMPFIPRPPEGEELVGIMQTQLQTPTLKDGSRRGYLLRALTFPLVEASAAS